VTSLFVVCESNISGTGEWICAKLTWKMCLVPRLDEFECQGHQGQNALCTPITPWHRQNGLFYCMMHFNVLAANNIMQQQMEPFHHCRG